MNSRLEQFIKDHREDFDSEEPAGKVWDNIRHSLEPAEVRKPASMAKIQYLRWAAAAAVLILAIAGVWYFTRPKTGGQTPETAAVNNDKKGSGVVSNPSAQKVIDTPQTTVTRPGTENLGANPSNAGSEEIDQNEISEEMYHYAKIVELRQKELKKLEKDEPLLYKQFSGDVNKLDSVYRSLKKQLSVNPNKEQLLEAMIQNLQLQIGLLNHQLDIIKQINHSKKSAYENAYKPA